MIDNLISVSVTMFVLMFSAYILIVLKEKVYLNNGSKVKEGQRVR